MTPPTTPEQQPHHRKKPAAERYNEMDEISSRREWNADFGLMVIGAFENAIRNGEMNKTVKQLVDEIEIEFNEAIGERP